MILCTILCVCESTKELNYHDIVKIKRVDGGLSKLLSYCFKQSWKRPDKRPPTKAADAIGGGRYKKTGVRRRLASDA